MKGHQMTTTTTRRPRGRRAHPAGARATGTATRITLLALAATVAASPASAAGGDPGAEAAEPNPSATIPLVPEGFRILADAVVEDDAVYAIDFDEKIWRRTLTTDAAGTRVGPLTEAGTTAPGSAYDVHDGTLAYTRASDRTVRLQTTTGAESTLAWATADTFRYGVAELSENWIVGISPNGSRDLYNRHTGAPVPLEDITPIPAPYEVRYLGDIVITADRVTWTVIGGNSVTDANGVYTVTLDPSDPDGVVGTPVTLDWDERPPAGEPGPFFRLYDTDSELIAWLRNAPTGVPTPDVRLRWQRGAPYTGVPAEHLLTSSYGVDVDGTTLIVPRHGATGSVEWFDLTGPATQPVRTLELSGSPFAANDRFLVWLVTASTPVLTDSTGAPVSIERTVPFSDVHPGDPFFDDIHWLVENGITGGYSDGTFRPRASVNRDAMAAFLYRLDHDGADAPDCDTDAFTDVPADHPFCGEITWLAETGITTGYPDGTFRPSAPVTREAMAAFLYRFDQGGGRAPACTTAAFSDVPAGHPFCGEISWLAGAGITNGWPDGTFRPGLSIERQAMAAFLHRVATRD